MRIRVWPDAETAAREAAAFIATEARGAIAARGQFLLAVSGGSTPWLMLSQLSTLVLPWAAVELFQVDERAVPAGSAARNFTHLRTSLVERVPLLPRQVHSMPIEATTLEEGARAYAQDITSLAGVPAVLDLVHLGLGPDGHTASLIPGDAVLEDTSGDVAVTGIYQSTRRMTLTYPLINRTRRVLWLVTGADKAHALSQLLAADPTVPAARIARPQAVVFADRAAAGGDTVR